VVVEVTVDDPGTKLITMASLGSESASAVLLVLRVLLMELSVTEPSEG